MEPELLTFNQPLTPEQEQEYRAAYEAEPGRQVSDRKWFVSFTDNTGLSFYAEPNLTVNIGDRIASSNLELNADSMVMLNNKLLVRWGSVAAIYREDVRDAS